MLIADVRRCMDVLEFDGRNLQATFIFPDDFVGFQGHFPQMPVLPGICFVQSLLVALEASRSAPVTLREIRSAKFFAPVRPRERLQLQCLVEPHGPHRCVALGRLATEGKRVAELRIELDCRSRGAQP